MDVESFYGQNKAIYSKILLASIILFCTFIAVIILIGGSGHLVLYLLTLANLVTGVLCWLRLKEPKVTLELYPQGVQIHEKMGCIQFYWQDIADIRQAMQDNQILPYLGLRLVNNTNPWKFLSNRHLMHLTLSQRELICHLSGKKPELRLEESPIESLKHIQLQLRQATGFDYLLHQSQFEQPISEILQQLNRYDSNRVR